MISLKTSKGETEIVLLSPNRSDLHHFLVPRQAETEHLVKFANSFGVRLPSDPCGLALL